MNYPKTNIRSFRFSDKVLKILEQQDGSSLSEKFDNLINACFLKIEERTDYLKSLENQIQNKIDFLKNLNSYIGQLERDILFLKKIGSDLEKISESVEVVTQSAVSDQRCSSFSCVTRKE